MASDDSYLVLVHYRGSIKKKMREGIKFTDKNPLSIFIKPFTNFIEFQNTIIQKLTLHDMKRYDSFIIDSDEDLQGLFHYRCQFFEMRTHELLAKLGNVVCSSRGDRTGILNL
ncbi:hypothetical protein Ahy_B06g084425 isoform B [Arachis hypogaea]|uniref:Uncharacterized protein n=1 Tax=Arachis hypogaea TaxID=3818 RepID=A0A444YRV0_ARAHY|nr:hypothetical protein Ahy_B06g084425 isoform B [Arachis hypogaea]